MQIIRDISALRRAVDLRRTAGKKIALVPTMGALHEGHLALVKQARRHADHVVASIFVNPTQFGPGEDLDAYPRREAEDAALLGANNVAILWAPSVSEMYPNGFATSIRVSGVSEGLCGAARPGHFDGVATVVAKLFNQVRPDVALFGEKDYQQLSVIRRMVRDLDVNVEVIGVPTQRAADGLALSSRNAYLSKSERTQATALPRTLTAAARRIAGGEAVVQVLDDAAASLIANGFASVDYVALCDADTLAPVESLARPARLLAAARLGTTRLIDNIAVNPLI